MSDRRKTKRSYSRSRSRSSSRSRNKKSTKNSQNDYYRSSQNNSSSYSNNGGGSSSSRRHTESTTYQSSSKNNNSSSGSSKNDYNYSSSNYQGNHSNSSTNKDQKSSKDSKESRDYRDSRDNRDYKDSRDSKDSRDNRDRDHRDHRDSRDNRDNKEHRINKDSRDREKEREREKEKERENKSSSNKDTKKHSSSQNKKESSYSRSHSRSHSRHRSSRSSSSSDEKKKQKSHEKLQSSSQQWNFKAKYDESKWLMIENIPETIEKKDIEEKLTQVSADCGTSIYDDIRLVPYLGSAYIQYPSVSAASKTLYHLKGKVKLKDQFYPIDFYNTTSGSNGSQSGGNQSKAASLYDNVQADWICDKCDYKNFAKRVKCNKCEKPRSSSCRLIMSSIGSIKPTIGTSSGAQGELTTSLMIRGNVVSTISESHLIDAFERYAKIKDVRLVKNKQTNQQKDFAFVEFYTIEDAEMVLAQTNVPEFRVAGEPVTVLISRNKKAEEASSSSYPMVASAAYDYNQQQYGAQYDYSQYYQQMYSQYGQQPTYIDYDAVGYTTYDQQQQQLQQAYQQQTEQILPSSPYKQVQQTQLQAQIPSQIQLNLAQQQAPQQQAAPMMQFDVTYETFDQSDLIKQALENVKNHSLTLQQQKEEEKQKQEQFRVQQQHEEQKKKEQAEKNLQAQKTMEDQIKILEEQKKALKKTKEDNKMKEISNKIQEKQDEQQRQKQRLEKLKEVSQNDDGNLEQSFDQEKSNVDSNKLGFIQFETNAFSTSSQPLKTIDFSLNLNSSSSSKQKEKIYICTICKNKFESDKAVNIHYSHSKLHKENLKLYGLI